MAGTWQADNCCECDRGVDCSGTHVPDTINLETFVFPDPIANTWPISANHSFASSSDSGHYYLYYCGGTHMDDGLYCTTSDGLGNQFVDLYTRHGGADFHETGMISAAAGSLTVAAAEAACLGGAGVNSSLFLAHDGTAPIRMHWGDPDGTNDSDATAKNMTWKLLKIIPRLSVIKACGVKTGIEQYDITFTIKNDNAFAWNNVKADVFLTGGVIFDFASGLFNIPSGGTQDATVRIDIAHSLVATKNVIATLRVYDQYGAMVQSNMVVDLNPRVVITSAAEQSGNYACAGSPKKYRISAYVWGMPPDTALVAHVDPSATLLTKVVDGVPCTVTRDINASTLSTCSFTVDFGFNNAATGSVPVNWTMDGSISLPPSSVPITVVNP